MWTISKSIGAPKATVSLFVLGLVINTSAFAASEYYDFEKMATTGTLTSNQEALTGLFPSVSINSSGQIAIAALTASGQAVYVANQPGPSNPGVLQLVSFAPNPSVQFFSAPMINEVGWVLDGRRSNNTTFAELYDSNNAGKPGSVVTVSSGNAQNLNNPLFPTPWAADLAFSALSKGENLPTLGLFQLALGVLDRNPPAAIDSAIVTPRMDIGGCGVGLYPSTACFNTDYQDIVFRQRIADDGTVVARFGTTPQSPIVQMPYTLGTFRLIDVAVTDASFLQVGQSPGVSASGDVVAFAGDRGKGPGIFISVRTGSNTRQIVSVAGEASGQGVLGFASTWGLTSPTLDFQSFQMDERVGVIHKRIGRTGLLDDSIIVAFLATPADKNGERYNAGRRVVAGLGLWTVRIDIVANPQIPGQLLFIRHAPTPVIQVGDTIETPQGEIGPIASITVHDAIAGYSGSIYPDGVSAADVVTTFGATKAAAIAEELSRNAHLLAFTVTDQTGTSSVIRATQVGCSTDAERLPQGSPAPWNADLLGSSPNHKLGSYGCVISTEAMQINYFGRVLSVRQQSGAIDPSPLRSKVGAAADPGQLNTFWNTDDPSHPIASSDTQKAFDSNNDLLRGPAVSLFNNYWLHSLGPLASPIQWVPFQGFYTDSLAQQRLKLLGRLCKSALETATSADGWSIPEPVSVRVHGVIDPTVPYHHDVLITGITKSDFVIADPSGDDQGRAIHDYGQFRLNGYIQDPDDASYISFSTAGDVGLMVTASGAQTGIDAVTGAVLEQIPNAVVNEEQNDDEVGSLPPDPLTRTVWVPSPPAITYTLDVSAASQGSFTLNISSTLANGATGPLNSSFSGVGVPNAAMRFAVAYGPTPTVSVISVPVPLLIGLTQNAAASLLTQARLALGVVTQSPSSAPAGQVIQQSLVVGSIVAPNTTVNLVVSSGAGSISVPNIVGLAQSAATTAIAAAGLTVGTVSTQSSATVASGLVISEDPIAGTSVVSGSAVNIVVSGGPAPVSVPNVVGLTQAAATTAITGSGLTLGTVTQQSSATIASGIVISESPTAGTSVAAKSAVNLVVSSGAAPVSVPNVVGLTQAAATSAITGAGLTLGTVTTQSSSSVAAGLVISESPTAGTSVTAKSTVSLVVSSGAAPVAVPNVVGLTQAAATTAITAAGLTLGSVTTQSSATIAAGLVISETPSAGTSVAAKSAVNIVVSSGAAPVLVPSVIGLTQAAAASALTTAGLTLGSVTTQRSSTVAAGLVISESPTAGSSVAAKSAVSLVVSSGTALVAVPNVVGLTQAAATSAITSTGLILGTVTTQSSATVAAGLVISESPTAGTSVTAKSAVSLVVSSGAAPVAVPNVVGLTQAAATTALTSAGLTLGSVTMQSSTTVAAGVVISESPGAGTSVAAKSAVSLVVSTGPAPVSVPNVVGSTQGAATTAITNAGLVLGTVTSQSSSTIAAGIVISESPAAGTSVAAKSAVSLVVSTGSLVGDLNDDGVVNCADLSIIKASFGKKVGQAGFDARADVNKDGVVNVLDLSTEARLMPTGTSCN
jgi:beta-lactam-binding protein with PASTA domain